MLNSLELGPIIPIPPIDRNPAPDPGPCTMTGLAACWSTRRRKIPTIPPRFPFFSFFFLCHGDQILGLINRTAFSGCGMISWEHVICGCHFVG